MNILKGTRLKIFLIVITCLILCMLLHMFVFPFHIAGDLSPSILMLKNLAGPIAGLAMLITLSALAFIFFTIQDKLSGNRFVKGLKFGIFFTGIWIMSFIEIGAITDITILNAVIGSIPDSVTILLMFLLLGFFIAQDTPITAVKETLRGQLISISSIAVIFIIGRYISYWFFGINNIFHPEPCPVFVWTIIMSVWIGTFYRILSKNSHKLSPIMGALYFSIVIFGIGWLLINLFAPIFNDISVFQMVLRVLFDVLFMTLGILLSKYFLVLLKRRV